MPDPDPLPSPRGIMKRRFWRIFRLLILLSIIVAAISVALVARGAPGIDTNILVATALGTGLTVLLGTSLMTLVFLSAESGHDDAAAQVHHETDEDDRP